MTNCSLTYCNLYFHVTELEKSTSVSYKLVWVTVSVRVSVALHCTV